MTLPGPDLRAHALCQIQENIDAYWRAKPHHRERIRPLLEASNKILLSVFHAEEEPGR